MMAKEGVDITQLEPNTQLVVETPSSIFNINVIDPIAAKINITGGSIFTEVTEAYIQESCNADEGKTKWVITGMCMIIRYKKAKQRKFRTFESDVVQGISIISADERWSYTI